MTNIDPHTARPTGILRNGRQALVLLAWCAATASPVLAAGAARPDAAQRYQREQARCMAIRVHGDRANCLSEASTAYQATLPRAASSSDPGRYTRNAQARCQALPPGDRQDCLSRMAGQGTTSGSVSGGGLYRELVTREPAVPASGVPPALPASAAGQPRPVDASANGTPRP